MPEGLSWAMASGIGGVAPVVGACITVPSPPLVQNRLSPATARYPGSSWPVASVVTAMHAPAAHVPPLQSFSHTPQWLASVESCTSQPFAASMSQSAVPGSHTSGALPPSPPCPPCPAPPCPAPPPPWLPPPLPPC